MKDVAPSAPLDPILAEVREFFESHHDGIEQSRRRHRYYYDLLTRILRVRVPSIGDEQTNNIGASVIVSRRALEELRTPR